MMLALPFYRNSVPFETLRRYGTNCRRLSYHLLFDKKKEQSEGFGWVYLQLFRELPCVVGVN